ncbi:MAG: hypothetical protein H7067_05270 [Burkholderiales bacterium]|nr:hypothetical protein [Opitutaceae bacterium]
MPARIESPAVAEPEAQVEALAEAGRFIEAVRLAESAPAGMRDTLLSAACLLWAINDPRAAACYVLAQADPATRSSLLKLVASVWAAGPQAPELVAFALGVSAEAERRILLDAGLTTWVARDVIEAAGWLSRQTMRAELDEGFSALATHPAVLAAQPDLAADWAARVTDVDLRRAALTTALKALHRINPANADRRLDEDTTLDRVEMNHLREILADS